MFILLYSKEYDNGKRYKAKRYYLPEGIILNYNFIINWKLTTGQSEDGTTGCVLDYEYVKNHYKLIAVDLSRWKQLFLRELQKLDKKGNAKNAGADQNIFVLTILVKIKVDALCILDSIFVDSPSIRHRFSTSKVRRYWISYKRRFTSKRWNWFQVNNPMSTWISKSIKYRRFLHVVYSLLLRCQINITSKLVAWRSTNSCFH